MRCAAPGGARQRLRPPTEVTSYARHKRTSAIGPVFAILNSMTKISENRGRPKTTGKGTLIGVRILPDLMRRLDQWILSQNDHPSRPEAIRRLAELALMGPFASTAAARHRDKKKAASQATELAGDVIDRLTDESAPTEEQEKRKRKLIKGPLEFCDLRKDQPSVRVRATAKAKAKR